MGKLSDDFKKEAKKANWHFSWFKKSSLTPIIEILKRFPNVGRGFRYSPAVPGDLDLLADAIRDLKAKKVTKYDKALTWLKARVAGLDALLKGVSLTLGETQQGYVPGKEVNRKDSDDRWHNFYLQQRGNSCGPTCVRTILKAYTHIRLPSEFHIRNMVGLVEHGISHTGVNMSAHDWENVGCSIPGLVQVLHSYGLKSARAVTGAQKIRQALRGCSKNEPGIVGWWWGPSFGVHDVPAAGHWTACVGPTENGQRFVILDPWNEIQYIDANQFWHYLVSDGSYGWFSPNDHNDPAVLVTH